MALPTLTWNLVGPVAITSGTVIPGGITGEKMKPYYMYTLKNLINSSSYWLVDVQDNTGSMTEALVLKPITSSATPNMRVIVTGNLSGVLGGSPVSTVMQDRAAGTPEACAVPGLMVGFTPDNSANTTWVTGSWNSDKPWGSNVRWSKYWFAGFPSEPLAQMYLIESSEALFIGLKGRRGSTHHYGAIVGAFIQSADSGSGEKNVGNVGRVFGMSCVGPGSNAQGPTSTWLTNTYDSVNNLGPFGCNANIDYSTYTGVFIVSGGIPNGTNGDNQNYWELCARATKLTLDIPASTETTGDRGTNVTSGETLVGIPLAIQSVASPFRMIGFLRQIYAVHDLPGLVTIATGVNNPTSVGITWAPDSYNAGDCIIFSNL